MTSRASGITAPHLIPSKNFPIKQWQVMLPKALHYTQLVLCSEQLPMCHLMSVHLIIQWPNRSYCLS